MTNNPYVELRPFFYETSASPPFIAEIEVYSGNPENDGLIMNKTLKRLKEHELIALRDKCNELLNENSLRK